MSDKEIKKGRKISVPRENKICKQCHKKFVWINYKDRSGLFCSHKCSVQFSRENSTQYRIKAFALLPNECFYCQEKKGKLLVHHKDKDFLNNDINNLQILCNSCHKKQHKHDNSRFKQFKEGDILRGIRLILSGLRVDLKDPNFKGTPERVLRSYYEIFEGETKDLDKKLKEIFSASFPSEYDGLVIESKIKVFSTCPHHMRDIEYNIDVGYISTKGRALGLSKIARVAKLLARRLVLQETLTHEICDAFMKNLKADGVMVVVKGKHNCMRMRGIENPDSITTTSSVGGLFKTDKAARNEFLELTKKSL